MRRRLVRVILAVLAGWILLSVWGAGYETGLADGGPDSPTEAPA